MRKPDHIQRARRAWRRLAQLANRRGRPFSYKEISTLIGVHWRASSWFLGVIQDYCKAHGLPRLQALAVNGKTRLPGGGYRGGSLRAAHARELERVYSVTWPLNAPF